MSNCVLFLRTPRRRLVGGETELRMPSVLQDASFASKFAAPARLRAHIDELAASYAITISALINISTLLTQHLR